MALIRIPHSKHVRDSAKFARGPVDPEEVNDFGTGRNSYLLRRRVRFAEAFFRPVNDETEPVLRATSPVNQQNVSAWEENFPAPRMIHKSFPARSGGWGWGSEASVSSPAATYLSYFNRHLTS